MRQAACITSTLAFSHCLTVLYRSNCQTADSSEPAVVLRRLLLAGDFLQCGTVPTAAASRSRKLNEKFCFGRMWSLTGFLRKCILFIVSIAKGKALMAR